MDSNNVRGVTRSDFVITKLLQADTAKVRDVLGRLGYFAVGQHAEAGVLLGPDVKREHWRDILDAFDITGEEHRTVIAKFGYDATPKRRPSARTSSRSRRSLAVDRREA